MQNLIKKLEDRKKYYLEIYHGAIKVTDEYEFQNISNSAWKNIHKIETWRNSLESLLGEISSSDIFDYDEIHSQNLDADESEEFITKNKIPNVTGIETGKMIDISEFEKTKKDLPAEPWEMNPNEVVLFGKKYDFRYWSNMYIKVCELMVLRKPYIMAEIDKDYDFNKDGKINFSYVRNEIIGMPRKLQNSLWIETDISDKDCVRLSRLLLEKCEYESESLIIESES